MHDETADTAGHPPDAATRAALTAALDREAAGVTPGSAPVDAVLRQGRIRRRRRGAAVACTVVTALALPLTVALWPHAPLESPPTSPPPVSTPPSAPSPSTSPTHSTVRVLEPYEIFQVSPGWRLALLAEGRQNYVFDRNANFVDSLEYRRGTNMGDSLRPNSFSINTGTANPHLRGAWRHARPPQRMTLTTPSGREYVADLFTLPDNPGWGVYSFSGAELKSLDRFTITAYDARGKAFHTYESEPL